MKVSLNFDVREFIPKHIWDAFGEKSQWFVSRQMVNCAEFYKRFFLHYYKTKLGPDKVKNVLIKVNTWHAGGQQQWRGLRTPLCDQGKENSQHRYMNAFDCEIVVVMANGTQVEADYREIHQVIKNNEAEFMANGVTTVEDVKIATGWLHTDFRWTGLTKILVVGA